MTFKLHFYFAGYKQNKNVDMVSSRFIYTSVSTVWVMMSSDDVINNAPKVSNRTNTAVKF